jgi:hypothetical protein
MQKFAWPVPGVGLKLGYTIINNPAWDKNEANIKIVIVLVV